MTANRRRKLVGKFPWKTFLACNDEFTLITSFPYSLLKETKLSVSVICVFLTPNPSEKTRTQQRFRQDKHTEGIYWKKHPHRCFCNKQRLQRKLAEYNAGAIR